MLCQHGFVEIERADQEPPVRLVTEEEESIERT